MTRERWQDSKKVKAARNVVLDAFIAGKIISPHLDALCSAVAEAVSVPPEAASEEMAPPIIYGKPHTHCDDCGTKMIWSSAQKESWMCPLCVLRRMHAAEDQVRRSAASQGEAERGGEAVAWQVVDDGGRIAHTAAYNYGADAAEIECRQWCEKFNSELQSYTHLARPCSVRPLYARSAGEGTPSVTAEDIAHYTSADGAFDSECDSCARILALLEGAQDAARGPRTGGDNE